MSTLAARLPRSPGSSQPAATVKRYTFEDISSTGNELPNRYGLHAVEGLGKTSIGTHTPNPIFIQSRGETGLETLIQAGQVAKTPHFPQCQTWEDVRAQIRFLAETEHQFRTLVIDTVSGMERLVHEFVCNRDFAGDWGERGFGGYQRGFEVSLAEWRLLLNDLDELRSERKMTIFLLAHTRVKNFRNPEGADYDRYVPDMHEKTWGLTHKWLDAVFFGNFETVVQTTRGADPTRKGKGSGGNVRMLYTQRTAAYDAKNRLGLAPEIDMGASATEAWKNLMAAIKAARAQASTAAVQRETAIAEPAVANA